MTMKVVIVEDEIPAADKLERYLKRIDPQIIILSRLSSINETVSWFKAKDENVDLVFMDIQLTDGKSFEIFNQVEIQTPIVFTTAYDEYAIKAFEVNSIAYLLKPISKSDLESALVKYRLISSEQNTKTTPDIKDLLAGIEHQKKFKSRFMVKIGEHIRSITTDQIMFFNAEGRNAYITNAQGRRLIIDYTLEELENILDPKLFFRVNRTFIVNINSINDVIVYSNSRLKIIAEVKPEKDIIVSREKVGAFKKWFDGE